MFLSDKILLKPFLDKLHTGAIQLPDFQRSWVWDEENIRSLLASVLNGYPVGALLTLETGGEVQFQPRALEGVERERAVLHQGPVPKPDLLLLDGQQRSTSLYQTLLSTQSMVCNDRRGKPQERFLYLDIGKALSGEPITETCVVPVPASRVIYDVIYRKTLLDVSTPQKEYESHLFPLNQIFNFFNWLGGWQAFWQKHAAPQDVPVQELLALIGRVNQYSMPYIQLSKDNGRRAVCTIFEKVNTGGKKLDAFELLTAMYAAEPLPNSKPFDLRADWYGQKPTPEVGKKIGRQTMLRATGHLDGVLKALASTEFMQPALLLHTMQLRKQAEVANKKGKDLPAITCKHEDLLDLPLQSYIGYADRVQRGFIAASKFVNQDMVLRHRELPYPPQLVTLATVFAALEGVTVAEPAKAKLRQWFWCVALDEAYSSSTETKIARDVPELLAWIGGSGPVPRTVEETLFQADRLDTLRSRLAAAYKAVHALMLRHGCRDFINGQSAHLASFYADPMDIHHIFPKRWCEKKGILPSRFNAIVNKTPISAASNRAIGGDAPSVYLKRIEEKHKLNSSHLDDILRTHLIDPVHLRNDDFEGFYQARKAVLGKLIEAATGKPVLVSQLLASAQSDIDVDMDEEDEEYILVSPEALSAST
ncbi:GmrSD restriction endonuclease domain-containing protein [Polaromonas sp. DSR2-3-2]|uniref:GmrSD restriction endonuclease domain-containing protein n=1 Tax=unclassified Polaromonas TaxID=2638319 RepID=UPI003CEC5FD6